MFGILGFFFFIIIIILIIGLAVVGNIVATVLRIFGIGRRPGRKSQSFNNSNNSQNNKNSSDSYKESHSSPNDHKGKIIGEDEGDYIDFEEIK